MPDRFQRHHGHKHDHSYIPDAKPAPDLDVNVATAAGFSLRGLAVTLWPLLLVLLLAGFWGLLKLNEKDGQLMRAVMKVQDAGRR
jgi:hypothetical protein